MKYVIPVGTSEPSDFELKNDGVAFNGTGFAVELEIKKKNGASTEDVEYPPEANWLVAAAGTVRVTGVETLEVGNYYVRYKVTDGSLNDGFFPNGEKADLWSVVEIPAR